MVQRFLVGSFYRSCLLASRAGHPISHIILALVSLLCLLLSLVISPSQAQNHSENDNYTVEGGSSLPDFGTVQFPGTGVWNGYNNHMVVAECVESGGERVALRIVVLRNDGVEIARKDFEIEAFGTTHNVLNEFRDSRGRGIENEYGTYRIEALNVPAGARLSCLTAMYRLVPGDPGTVEYAYAIPLLEPLVGKSYGLYNSMDPLDIGQITYNFVTVYNPGEASIDVQLIVYRQDGSLDKVVPFTLPPGGRRDEPVGHDRGFVTGLYAVDVFGSKPYGAYVARYSPRANAPGFNFAFAALASPGFCNQAVPVSSMGYAINWIEIANPNNEEIEARVTIRTPDGVSRLDTVRSIPSGGQIALNSNDAIDPTRQGQVGSALISCDPATPLVVQSTFYGRNTWSSPQLRWAYSSVPTGAPPGEKEDLLVGSVNVFLRAANWLKVVNGAIAEHIPFFAIRDNMGEALLSSEQLINPRGTTDINIHETMHNGGRQLGTIGLSGAEVETSLLSELIRVYYDPNNVDISAIMPTPVTIIRDGAKLRASAVNATTVENSSLALEPVVSDPLNRQLKVEIVEQPEHGVATVGDTELVYRPNAHYRGPDQFHFRVALNNVQPERALVSDDAVATIDVDPRSTHFAGDANLLQRYREDLTAEEVDSVLKRVAFGGTPEQRNIRNLSQLVSSLLDTPENARVDSWLTSFNNSRLNNPNAENTTISQRWFFWGHFEHVPLYSFRYGNPSLNWWALLFWHNHFTTDLSLWSNSANSMWMVDHYRRLKRNALGNMHTFLSDMIHDGSFHEHLNSFTNTYLNPSQNFPREWLELFTVGVVDPVRKLPGTQLADPNYNETDMQAATRALSGFITQTGDTGYRDIPNGTYITPTNFQATDGKYLAQMTVRPSAEQDPHVKLIWDAMALPGGTTLRVRRSIAGQNNFEIIRTGLARDSGSVDDDTAVQGVRYDYILDIVYPGNVIRSSQPDQGYIEYGTGVPQPQNIQCSRARTDGRVVLNWSAAAGGVVGYRIYRLGYDMGVYPRMLGQVSADTFSFSDLTARPNMSYAYFVRSVAADGTLSPLDELNIKNGNHVAPVAAVRNPTWTIASDGTSSAVQLNWEPVPGASRYRIFRSAAYKQDWNLLADTPDERANFVDTSAALSAWYHYLVVSLDAAGRESDEWGGAQFRASRWNQSPTNLTNLTFLEWQSAEHPNSSARITQARPISATGESFDGEPPVLSFIDHIVYNWPALRRNIAARLFASVAHRQLNEQLLSSVSSGLESTGYDIKETLRQIYSSSAMFAPESVNTCVSSPLEVMMIFLRRLDIQLDNEYMRSLVAEALNFAGQTTFAPPSVFGWNLCGLVRSGKIHDGSDWMLSAQTFISVANGITRTIWGLANYLSLPINSTLVPSAEIRVSAPATVDYIANALGVSPNAEQRVILIEYLNTGDNGLPSAWTGQETQRKRLSGLIRMLVTSLDFIRK